ncbi:hypothetical protein [Bradyrhizobium sp. LMG 9283]
MPSHHLVRQFDDIFAIENEWCWSGTAKVYGEETSNGVSATIA